VTPKARCLVILLSCAMVSLWLTEVSGILVIACNGLSGVPAFVDWLVSMAYWPMLAMGTPRHLVFQQGHLISLAINLAGYLIIGLGICVFLEIGSARRRVG
jgi:hypothetical protein